MIRKRISFYTIFLVLSISVSVYGQRIRFYDSDQGLPNSLINKVTQDDKGYIWLATENGACYFDGRRFTTFRHDRNQSGTLANDLIKTIFTDSKGVTWVGTANGLQIYDREKNTFRDFPLQYPDFMGTPYINSIIEDKKHSKLLVSVAACGILVYNLESHKLDLETTQQLKSIFKTNYLGNLFLESEGYIWSYSEQGSFFRLDLTKMQLDSLMWGPEMRGKSQSIVVTAITEDPIFHNILIGTYNDGILIYDREKDLIRKPKELSTSNYNIRALLAERIDEGKCSIWVGTEDAGLKKFDRTQEKVIEPDFQYGPIDLENCKVHSIMQDVQGNIWAGIFQKGLLIIPKSTNDFEYIKMSAMQGSMSVNIACVTSIIRDQNDNLWVGTDGGGLFRILEDGTKIRYTKENTPLPNNSILTITQDKRGTLWISTYMGGITTYNPKTGFRAYSHDLELKKVSCSLYDRENDRLFFGTLGYGLKVLSFSDNRLEAFTDKENLKWINSLYMDNSDNLWVGHTEGVCCFNLKTGKNVTCDLGDIIQGHTISSVLEDRDGSMWFGSTEGICHYQKENNSLTLISKKDGLASNMVCSIQQDENGKLWISTLHGLSRLDPGTGKIRNFYAYDGLQDNEFRMKAGFMDKDGKLFFGGINGITAFYPDKITGEEKLTSKLYFSQLRVLNQSINYDASVGNKNILDRHISQAHQITLKNNQNVFSLEFTVLEFANPEKVVYGYRLEGFDNDWRYTDSKSRSATYTNLPEGSYVFRVKAFFEGNSDEQNVVYNSINIRILPPWYKSRWAYLIYFIILVLIVWWFWNFLMRRRKRIMDGLELEKKELKLRMFTDLTHEIRTPFTLVMTPLKTMQESETDPKRKEMFNFMYRNILRILRLLNQLIDIRKIDNRQFRMHFQKTDLIYFIQDIIQSFEQLAIMRNIEFRLISNFESLEVWMDQENFDKVLFNILSNAFKFTPDHGQILISVNTVRKSGVEDLSGGVTDFIELSIENSGSKIDETEIGKIFDRFYQSSNNKVSSGSGIGLHLAKMIVELHHGKIMAKNTDTGTAFIVYIPQSDKYLSSEEISDTEKTKKISTRVRQDDELYQDTDVLSFQPTESELHSRQSKSKRTLLFVDDDTDMGKYISMELSDKYNVKVCSNTTDAWKEVTTTGPDIILLDLIMADGDGISLCKKIRKNPETNHLPVIILTSETEEESERQCLEAGADHFLSKPVSLELLKSTIAQAVQLRDMIRNKYTSNVNPDFKSVRVSSPDSKLVARVVETIRKNIENPEFSVDDLSREVGLSRVHLNRKLKENVNISPSNLIKSIRLKQAAYLLINNKVNISDVAYKVGFSSHSYFSNNFKEYFGMAPTEFVGKYAGLEDKESINKLFEN